MSVQLLQIPTANALRIFLISFIIHTDSISTFNVSVRQLIQCLYEMILSRHIIKRKDIMNGVCTCTVQGAWHNNYP